MQPDVYSHLLKRWAEQTPDAAAILAPGKKPLGYGDLWRSIEQVARTLRALGIQRNDRVATVLPKSADAVVLHLAVSACATCVPLNPASREAEIDYATSVLATKYMIVQAGAEEPAAGVARARGMKITVMSPSGDSRTGQFDLHGDVGPGAPELDFAEPDDIALFLQTSGTTSRPKMVPYSQRAFCTGVLQWAEAFGMSPETCYLNTTPLFHMHGVVSGLMPLLAGARVLCTRGFDPDEFFAWLDEFRVTTVSLVPTMLQAIVAAAPSHQDSLARSSLRLIFSSAAALNPKAIADLERLFGAPVLEVYGLTEVTGSVLCNPRPPGKRKAGSVGVPKYHEVAIMDSAGRHLGPGEQGDIVVRGSCVMPGYLGDQAATDAAFRDGWLVTGDRGYRDEEGYYYVTGRTKEIINRGGEKISPREVDDVLMDHAAVLLAVTFAVPHATLGEDVAAAVVLADGAEVTSRELRNFAAARLAQHKVPRRILIVDDLPKSASGKPLRIGLAAKLNIQTTESVYTPPRTALEAALAGILADVLGVAEVGIHDDFFELGGDSIKATQFTVRTQETLPVDLWTTSLLEYPTIAEIAARVEGGSNSGAAD